MAVVALGAITGAAMADTYGTVAVTTRGCLSRYVVDTPSGYVLAEWYGGHDPDRGDTVEGDLNSYGFKDVLINGSSSRAYIDDYMLSRDSVIRKLREHGCTVR